jgi:hypothetical protein
MSAGGGITLKADDEGGVSETVDDRADEIGGLIATDGTGARDDEAAVPDDDELVTDDVLQAARGIATAPANTTRIGRRPDAMRTAREADLTASTSPLAGTNVTCGV